MDAQTQDSFAFSQLFDEDSILKHLMDDWNEGDIINKPQEGDKYCQYNLDSIKEFYNTKISLHKNWSQIIPKCKELQYLNNSDVNFINIVNPTSDVKFLKTKLKEMKLSIFNLVTKESQFVGKEREVIEELLEKTDDFFVDLTLKYFNNLKILKEIETEKRIYVGKKLTLQK